ncbi:MAG: Na+ dependent nucleoside transporter N-terminal domain-containing protein, partial [Gemmatimonadales bacterium]
MTSWRRVVFTFAVTFICALVVFTLPRFVFNTVSSATVQTPSQDTTKAQPEPPATPPPSVTPRSIATRLTGIFGLIVILGIGIAFSRNRRAISWRVVAWGIGLQLLFA